ncbi:DgyrCDS12765 [Dimorphilus gyrociliatus]|uniref:alpha-1,2-Mannosidase n=1 Tax=Dimorphilus gyrociliatus TaxID=2664684 RepID=A0A7I8W8G3_9ANNE|nr:DgyrCDS12765 [Dimorphilus gyrociliatus]
MVLKLFSVSGTIKKRLLCIVLLVALVVVLFSLLLDNSQNKKKDRKLIENFKPLDTNSPAPFDPEIIPNFVGNKNNKDAEKSTLHVESEKHNVEPERNIPPRFLKKPTTEKSKSSRVPVNVAETIEFKGPSNKEQQEIVNAFLHAWRAYEKYAWGKDELHPLSKSGGTWFNCGLTILDSLDTMWIMNLKDEFAKGRKWVAESLRFNHPHVQLFEIVIRALGGLLSAYHFSGDAIFAEKARDLGNKLMPCVKAGLIPCRFADLSNPKSNRIGDHSTAEVGTIQLEFRDLARVFEDKSYEDPVNNIMRRLGSADKFDGLASANVNSQGEYQRSATVGAGASIDSYYEYLVKMWLQGGKTENDLKKDYITFVGGMKRHLLKYTKPGNLAFVGSLNGFHGSFRSEMEHLACFLPGTMALGVMKANMPKDHLDIAAQLTETCYQMYVKQPTGLSPEVVYMNTDPGSSRDFGQSVSAL